MSELTVADLEKIFKDKHSPLVHFVKGLIGQNTADAEDIIQEAFIQALKSLESFKGDSKPSTWIFGIARFLALNFKRSIVRKRKLTIVEVEDINLIAQDTYCASNLIDATRTLKKLKVLFDSLEPELLDTAELVLLEGFSYDEVAVICRIPLGTVRSRVSRIRALIKSCLDEE